MLIQPYIPEWKQHFEALKAVIQAALIDEDITIEHIGSTAVPGLAAKPIIDIDLIYQSDAAFERIKHQLSTIGYYHNGDQGIAKREAFKRQKDAEKHPVLDRIAHHLYACPPDSEELQRHLLFRDYLRKNASARTSYQNLKYKLAEEVDQDRKAYAALKEKRARAFVLSILVAAQ